jgi:dihydrolipoamide dehydrogenase
MKFKEAQRLLKKKGIKFFTDPIIHGNEVALTIEVNGNKKNLSAEKVLLSVGRKANVENFGSENMSVEVKDGVLIQMNSMRLLILTYMQLGM